MFRNNHEKESKKGLILSNLLKREHKLKMGKKKRGVPLARKLMKKLTVLDLSQ